MCSVDYIYMSSQSSSIYLSSWRQKKIFSSWRQKKKQKPQNKTYINWQNRAVNQEYNNADEKSYLQKHHSWAVQFCKTNLNFNAGNNIVLKIKSLNEQGRVNSLKKLGPRPWLIQRVLLNVTTPELAAIITSRQQLHIWAKSSFSTKTIQNVQ